VKAKISGAAAIEGFPGTPGGTAASRFTRANEGW
jgi:hypothetical protein